MSVFLVGRSALELWQRHRSAQGRSVAVGAIPTAALYAPHPRAVPVVAPNDQEVLELLGPGGPLDGLRLPVHVAVDDGSLRRPSRLKRCMVVGGGPLGRSFVPMGGGVYAPTPEALCLQLARHLSRVAFVQLLYGLCGSYVPLRQVEGGSTAADPLTSTVLLSAYARELAGTPGVAHLLRGVRRVIDGAVSPGQASLAMVLSLPVASGGFGLPAPQMAQDPEAYACGLFWPDALVAVVCDCKGERQVRSPDYPGLCVLRAPCDPSPDAGEFINLASELARRLGTSVPVDHCRFDWYTRHLDLCAQVLGAGTDPGAI